MTEKKTGNGPVLRGLYVLYVLGVSVGLALLREWVMLFWFGTVIIGAHGFAALVLEWLTRRDMRRKEK